MLLVRRCGVLALAAYVLRVLVDGLRLVVEKRRRRLRRFADCAGNMPDPSHDERHDFERMLGERAEHFKDHIVGVGEDLDDVVPCLRPIPGDNVADDVELALDDMERATHERADHLERRRDDLNDGIPNAGNRYKHEVPSRFQPLDKYVDSFFVLPVPMNDVGENVRRELMDMAPIIPPCQPKSGNGGDNPTDRPEQKLDARREGREHDGDRLHRRPEDREGLDELEDLPADHDERFDYAREDLPEDKGGGGGLERPTDKLGDRLDCLLPALA